MASSSDAHICGIGRNAGNVVGPWQDWPSPWRPRVAGPSPEGGGDVTLALPPECVFHRAPAPIILDSPTRPHARESRPLPLRGRDSRPKGGRERASLGTPSPP